MKPIEKFSFRLSEEEEKAVRELLVKMRGKLIILLCLLTFCLPVSAQTLQGGVTYTEETARQEAFEGIYKYCPYPDVTAFNRSLFVASINNDDVLSIQEFNTKLLKAIPYKVTGVIYKDLPNYTYYYEKTKNGYRGVAIDVTFGTSYPVKTAKYDARIGKLLSVSFDVSEYESFVYDTDKKLIAHWQGERAKEITTRTEITRKNIYSVQVERKP